MFDLKTQDATDEMQLEDKLEKMFFMLSNIVDNYYLPRGKQFLSPHDILDYMTGKAEDDDTKKQEATIAVEYGTIITSADIARDYCLSILTDLEEKGKKDNGAN